ncbi:hypothetical protein NE865_02429 [Phthorimaea operculella]|nr:hypothetical protein NE865_02429 [Phthorimaea operculella]
MKLLLEPSSSGSSRHGERTPHHVKSHSRDLGISPITSVAATPRDLEDSPQKKPLLGLLSGGEYAGPVFSPNVSYALSDDYTASPYRGQDNSDYSNQDDLDSSGNVTSSKALAAIAHLNSKVEKTKELIRLEQTIRDDNVNEYLKLAANADKQQLQRIKAVFEKKNQKSALCIAQLQKKLDGYNKRIENWEFLDFCIIKPSRIKAVFEKKNQKSALCIAQLQKKLDGYNKRIKNWENKAVANQCRLREEEPEERALHRAAAEEARRVQQEDQELGAVFEKKNQKSALCIAQLQKKLDGYNKRIKNWEQNKDVFEKKNQKSALCIAQLQKKLDGYNKRIKNWEVR